jgi:hypothetical protein
MNCQQAEELLIYVESNDPCLSAPDRAAYFEHIAGCNVCREEFEQGQFVCDLIQRHARLSPETVERLESEGQLVPAYLRPQPREEPVFSDEHLEAGLATLLAKIDEIEALKPGHAHSIRLQTSRTANTRPSGSLFPVRWRIAARLATAACLALVAVLGWWWSSARISPISGGAVRSHRWQHTVQLVTSAGEQAIPLGQPVITNSVRAELLLDGQHRVVMNNNTTATVDIDGEAFTINLARGELYVEVVPGHAFAVSTPHAQLTITGTQFNVKADPAQTELALLKGSVRFTSLANEQTVDVTAGHASQVAGRSAPTTPRQVDAQLVTAWARQTRPALAGTQTLPGAGAGAGAGEGVGRPGDGFAWLEDMPLDSLMPEIPDYRTWSYERFRDEMRPWFAEQFPWAMELEKALNEEYGIEADYLDVLVISGDIWQFSYQGSSRGNFDSPFSTFYLNAVKRLTGWYGLSTKPLLDTLSYHADAHTLNDHTGEAFAVAIERWGTDIAQADQQKLDDLALFSLKASAYLTQTRVASYLWIKEHPEQAQRLLASDDYTATFLASRLPIPLHERLDPTALLHQLDTQIDASHCCYQQAQQLILLMPQAQQCPAKVWTELKRRFNERLAPLVTAGKGDSK